MIRVSSISHSQLQTLGDEEVQSVLFVVCRLSRMLSQPIVIESTTQFFSASVLGTVNIDVKITNNNYTVTANAETSVQ